jgi:TonB-linked SusC/RagA family outer membrane protein
MKFKYSALLVVSAMALYSPRVLAGDASENDLNPQNVMQTGQRTIKGLVTESNGNPVIGATINIVGKKGAAVTNIDGRYELQVTDGDEIVISYLGFGSEKRIVKKGVDVLNVQMQQASTDLNDVVVVGYGQQKKESVVSSVSVVSGEDLHVSSRSLNNSLAGKVSGLLAVQRSGEPGWDDAQFWIRGVSSYAGGTDPLVIVDGVPRKMNDIDVDEIESFSVLKDAAATAVYGAEGANGVVLITSKRGKSQRTKINASVEYGVSTPLRLPSLLDSYSYLSLYNEAKWNDAGNPESAFTMPFSDEILEKYRTGADPDLYPNANWMDMLKKHTENQRYTVNFRGGSDKVRFFVSGAYYTENGIYKKNENATFDSNVKFDRYNMRTNVDFDLSKSTRMSVDMSGQYINRVAPNKTAAQIFNGMTLMPVHLIPMIYSDGTPSEHPATDGLGLRDNPYNYLYFSGYCKSWEITYQTKVTLEQDLNFITDGLSVKGTVSFDGTAGQYINRTMSAHSFYATGRNADGTLILEQKNAGSALSNPSASSSPGNKKIYLEASLNYKHTFGKLHDVTGLLLYNQKETQYQNYDGLSLLPYRKQSVVARATYGYDNRYMMEGSFGMTGSENFAPGHRWGIFPAIGGAWFVSHEKFFQHLLSVFNKFKLRASIGLTGNDEIGASSRFPYLETMNTGATGMNLGISSIANGSSQNWMGGLTENQAAAINLQWEVERKADVGIDLGFLNGRIDMSVDYFSDRRKDILLDRNTIPAMTGLRKGPTQNFGVVTNKGVDGNITFKEHIGKLNVQLRGNFTYSKNKIVECDEVSHLYAYQDYTGCSIGTPLIYIADGLYTPDDFNVTTNSKTGAKTYTLKSGLPNPGAQVSPGDIKYRDMNGDGVINDYDMTYHSNCNSSNPKTVYGIALDLDYKGFFGGVFFQGAGGCSVNLMSKATNFMPFNQGVNASSARSEALNRWTYSDPYNQDVLYPRMHSESFSYNLKQSTWWYRNASFIRFKNVEFGYQFNHHQLRSVGLENLRFYVQGTNLITWDDVKYWDPELGNANSGAQYPISRSWKFGVEITF